MAYNPTSENFALLRRIVTGLTDFKGRSRQGEIWVFLVAMILINGVALIITGVFARDFSARYGQYLEFALWLFAIPVFARRLHDQNRSGWLALILPAILVLKVYGRIRFDAGQLLIPELPYPYNVAEAILVIAFWVLIVWPGTDGENRFGHDPRRDLAADQPSRE